MPLNFVRWYRTVALYRVDERCHRCRRRLHRLEPPMGDWDLYCANCEAMVSAEDDDWQGFWPQEPPLIGKRRRIEPPVPRG